MKTRTVGIYIFDDVEVLDFAGPFEVFSVAGQKLEPKPFQVFLMAQHNRPIIARNTFQVLPHFTLESAPIPDLLLIPGGGGHRPDGTPFGTRLELSNPVLLEYIHKIHPQTELTLSVCTGALILAKAGLLSHQKANTHHLGLEALQNIDSSIDVQTGIKWVESGKLITSGGISAGIDMSLHVVAKLLGKELALETAHYMEYDWFHANTV
jgi:transcriptional regulator GlxA family with amidase domain